MLSKIQILYLNVIRILSNELGKRCVNSTFLARLTHLANICPSQVVKSSTYIKAVLSYQGSLKKRENCFVQKWRMNYALVTQPMLQGPQNQTEVRLMDCYIQILCIFQKCNLKVPPPLLLRNAKSPFTLPKKDFSHPQR